jgi:hypothetical protein
MGCRCEGGQVCHDCDDSLFNDQFDLVYNPDTRKYEIQRGESK